ncbi:hypothetical protein F1C58_16570 (plasmid) [Glaciihabitans sp. INWT7]|uniref:hypothetical protein n=1 Tax=Glaciihabitans sp. INWT7 TaxID=2596912 RepID=UPI0016296358|nr:hypothetical protein [Glaciihabitans sp. INWT7]QNE48671.1 hypothetical protein F1C58_16570 [Glaciihabitans sp. INWT7]
MKHPLRTRAQVLQNRTGGISVSIPDLMVSMIVRIIVLTGLVSAIGVMLFIFLSTTTSTQTSASFQASSLRFTAAVGKADIVKGLGTDTAVLMTTRTSPSGVESCDIVTWRDVQVNGVLTLVNDKASSAGKCDDSTPIPAPSPVGRDALLANVTPSIFTFENVGGRSITFDSAGNATLAAAVAPAGVPAQDWADVRPQRVEMKLGADAKGLTTYARNAKMVGLTSVVNFAEAQPGSKYVPPAEPIVAPSAIGQVWVTRSATAGDIYGGVREGATVSFLGGICQDMPSLVTITWAPSSPAGQSPESATFSRVMNGNPTVFNMPRVRNGSEGEAQVSVKCDLANKPDEASALYTQTVPATSLTVANGTTAEKHDLSWTPVSSLPTTFGVTWTAAPVKPTASGDEGSTTALAKTVTFPLGTTYGFATNYKVTPTVNGLDGNPAYGGVSNAWPAAPMASAITYTGTGSGAKITDGSISWGYAGACPAGTVSSSREIQNKIWNGTTGAVSTGNYTIGAFGTKTNAVWNPTYALEGYPYQERVDTKCVSPVTGSQSKVSTAQSATFYTRMNSPAAPVYDGFDFRDFVRGDTEGFATCWNIQPTTCNKTYPAGLAINGGGFNESYQMDFITYCPAGSKLGWSYYHTENLSIPGPGNDKGYFGKQDGWQIGDGTQVAHYLHSRPVYKCDTLWVTSPVSVKGADVHYNVNRVWG